MGGEVALGHRENLRWNKFSSFILTTCSSSAGGEAQKRGGGNVERKKETLKNEKETSDGNKKKTKHFSKLKHQRDAFILMHWNNNIYTHSCGVIHPVSVSPSLNLISLVSTPVCHRLRALKRHPHSSAPCTSISPDPRTFSPPCR